MDKLKQIYNEEIKTEFINMFNKYAVRSGYNLIFKKTSKQELALNKDIYEMDLEETKDLLKMFEFKTTFNVGRHISLLSSYVDWAKTKGLVKNGLNHFNTITTSTEILDDYVSKTAKQEQLIDIAKLELYMYKLIKVESYQDAILLFLLFLGIPIMKHDEVNSDDIKNLKYHNIDLKAKTVNLNNGITVDYGYMTFVKFDINDIIEKAIKQEYLIMLKKTKENGIISNYWKEFNSIGYVIKSSKNKNNEKEPILHWTINKRINAIAEFLELKYLSGYSIQTSAYINYIKSHIPVEKHKQNESFQKLIDVFKLDTTIYVLKIRIIDYL